MKVRPFRTIALLLLSVGLGLAACSDDDPTIDAGDAGTDTGSDAASDAAGETTAPVDGSDDDATERSSPPPLLVTGDGTETELQPFSYCWNQGGDGICADGAPEEPLPAFPASQPLTLNFEIPGWIFSASAMTSCQTGSWKLEPIDDIGWELTATGISGSSQIMIFGRGAEGDAAYALELESSGGDAGAGAAIPRGAIQLLNLVEPEQSGDLVVWLEGPDEVLDIESIEVSIAGQGAGEPFDLTVGRDVEAGDGECRLTRKVGSRAAGDAVALAGTAPWTYTVTVVTGDGSAFQASATQDPMTIPAGLDDSFRQLAFEPVELPEVEQPGRPDLGVSDTDAEAAVRQYLALLADGDYQGAATAAIWADIETESIVEQAIDDGVVTAGIPFPDQLEQWCQVAQCSSPESIVSQGLNEFGSGLVVLATWPDGATATFDVAPLEGLNVLGLPPR